MIDRLPRSPAGAFAVEFGDGLAVYLPGPPARVQVLNSSAAVVWRACESAMTRGDLLDQVVAACGVPGARVAADVDQCLERFTAEGLVVPPSGAGRSRRPEGDFAVWSAGSDPACIVGHQVPDLAGRGRSVGPVAVLDRRLMLVGAASDTVHDGLMASAEDLLADLCNRELDESLRYGVESVVVEVVDSRLVRQWGPGPGHRVFDGPAAWLEALPTDLNRHTMRQEHCLVLHAAGLVSPDGGLVVLCAPSGAGKSTLAATMVGAGWRYLSDEAVGLRFADLTTVAYPKPLVLDQRSREALGLPTVGPGGDNVRVGALGGTSLAVGVDHQRPVTVVIPRFQHGAAIEVARCDAESALGLLVPEVLNFAGAGRLGLAALVALVTEVSCFELVHSGGDAAAAALSLLAGT